MIVDIEKDTYTRINTIDKHWSVNENKNILPSNLGLHRITPNIGRVVS